MITEKSIGKIIRISSGLCLLGMLLTSSFGAFISLMIGISGLGLSVLQMIISIKDD